MNCTTSIATHTLNIAGFDLIVHVLDDGQRVFEAESAQRFFNALFGGEIDLATDDADLLASFVASGSA